MCGTPHRSRITSTSAPSPGNRILPVMGESDWRASALNRSAPLPCAPRPTNAASARNPATPTVIARSIRRTERGDGMGISISPSPSAAYPPQAAAGDRVSANLSESSVRSFCNVLQKPAGLTRVFVACRLLFHGRMTGDRSALIPGIYSYCDRRCERCRFSERCFSFRESVHVAVAPLLETASAAVAGTMSAQCRQPPPVDRSAAVAFLAASRTQEAQDALREEATFNDVLVARSREYALITWRILRTLRPIVDLRGDRQVREALDTAEYFSGMVASKIFRAV